MDFLQVLCPSWETNMSVSYVINNIQYLLNIIENDSENNQLFNYGTYKNNMIYSINDFLIENRNNYFSKVEIIDYNNEYTEHIEKYLVLTRTHFLLFNIGDKKEGCKNFDKKFNDLSKGTLFYVGLLGDINKIIAIPGTKNTYNEEEKLPCFSVYWNSYIKNPLIYEIYANEDKIKEIVEEIENRKNSIVGCFCFSFNRIYLDDKNTVLGILKS